MEMFLMAACMSLFGLAVSALAFGAASSGTDRAARQPEERIPAALPSHFFADEQLERVAAAGTQIPIEVLLLQIERHVRLEQAAAESFLQVPTAASLHSRTASPLVH
jgi:hypothetical protein